MNNNYEEENNNIKPLYRKVYDLPPQEEDLEHYITVLYGHQKNCEREGRYEEAYFTKNKIEKYKKLVESKSKVDLKEKHKNEKVGIESAHLEEFREFNDFWDKKMHEYDEEAKKVEESLIQKNEEDFQSFQKDVEASIPMKTKDTATLLNLRKIEESLAKQEKYLEAHKAQQQRLQLEKEERDKWNTIRQGKIKAQLELFRKKKETELNALRQRIKSGQEEQKKAREIELERLLHKYQNVTKELEIHQGNEQKIYERNMKIPSTVGLSKYYSGSRSMNRNSGKKEEDEEEN